MDNLFWWASDPFTVAERDLEIRYKAGQGSEVCRVKGHDGLLDLYQVEIVGGAFDGETFYVGFGWVKRYCPVPPPSDE